MESEKIPPMPEAGNGLHTTEEINALLKARAEWRAKWQGQNGSKTLKNGPRSDDKPPVVPRHPEKPIKAV